MRLQLVKIVLAVLCASCGAWSKSVVISAKMKFISVFASMLASQVALEPLTAETSQVAPPLSTVAVYGIKKEELMTELESYNEEIVSSELRRQREPKYLLDNLKKKLVPNRNNKKDPLKSIENAINKILTLKAYLDEAERDLFLKNWDNLQIYLYTFADQEDSFAYLIDNLFPQGTSYTTRAPSFTYSLIHSR